MEKSSLAILAFLLLGGCADSSKDVETATSKSPTAKATESVSDTTLVDASVLLASTLANAKATDKRVMVRLGAPW